MAQAANYRTPGPLQLAVAAGDVELVRDLLAAGEDPNKLDETGHCAIRWAMAMIHIKRRPEDADTVRRVFACIELCLDAGALPDGPTDSPESCRRRNENRTSRVHVSSARSLSSG